MKKYRWVLTAVFAAFLVGTSGCGKKTEGTTNPSGMSQ